MTLTVESCKDPGSPDEACPSTADTRSDAIQSTETRLEKALQLATLAFPALHLFRSIGGENSKINVRLLVGVLILGMLGKSLLSSMFTGMARLQSILWELIRQRKLSIPTVHVAFYVSSHMILALIY